MKYIKAFYALKEKNLTYLAAVFASNITDLMTYILENKEIRINDIENGKINDLFFDKLINTIQLLMKNDLGNAIIEGEKIIVSAFDE